jgi:hypothetical protein
MKNLMSWVLCALVGLLSFSTPALAGRDFALERMQAEARAKASVKSGKSETNGFLRSNGHISAYLPGSGKLIPTGGYSCDLNKNRRDSDRHPYCNLFKKAGVEYLAIAVSGGTAVNSTYTLWRGNKLLVEFNPETRTATYTSPEAKAAYAANGGETNIVENVLPGAHTAQEVGRAIGEAVGGGVGGLLRMIPR